MQATTRIYGRPFITHFTTSQMKPSKIKREACKTLAFLATSHFHQFFAAAGDSDLTPFQLAVLTYLRNRGEPNYAAICDALGHPSTSTQFVQLRALRQRNLITFLKDRNTKTRNTGLFHTTHQGERTLRELASFLGDLITLDLRSERFRDLRPS